MSFLLLLVTTLATAQVLYTAIARRQIFVSAILDTSVSTVIRRYDSHSIITAIQKLYAILMIVIMLTIIKSYL